MLILCFQKCVKPDTIFVEGMVKLDMIINVKIGVTLMYTCALTNLYLF